MMSAATATPTMMRIRFNSANTNFNDGTPAKQFFWNAFHNSSRQAKTHSSSALLLKAPTKRSLPDSMWAAKLRLRSMHRIAQHADSGNFDFDDIAGSQG